MATNVIEKLQANIRKFQEDLLTNDGTIPIKDPKNRRKCPVCNMNLKLYFFSLKEKYLMCENNFCDFPLGYEALQIVTDESQLRPNPVKATKDFFMYPIPSDQELPRTVDSKSDASTSTMSSLSSLSDCDGLSQMGDRDKFLLDKLETLTARLSRQDLQRKSKQQKHKDVLISLKQTKKLTEEMNQLAVEPKFDNKGIKNKIWLNKLNKWEVSTGKKLLTDVEKQELVKIKSYSSNDEELKVSISPTNIGENATLNIQIFELKQESQIKSDNNEKMIYT